MRRASTDGGVPIKHADTARQEISRTRDERVGDDPVFAEKWKTSNDARRHVGQLVIEDRIQEAYGYIGQLLKVRPDLGVFMSDVMINCELLLGRYEDAYDELVPLVNAPQSDDPGTYLRLSLACAARGEVYPGQMEYCAAWLSKFYEDEHPGRNLELSPTRLVGPRLVMLQSALALAMRNSTESQAYFDLALRLDSTNEAAADEAILRYSYHGRYSDMRRVASTIAGHLSPGAAREKYQTIVTEFANRKDKPLPRIDKPDGTVIHP